MNANKWILVIALTLILTPAPSFALSVGDKAPPFMLRLLDGSDFASKDVVGKNPLALVFWTTWCPNCKRELPHLAKMYETFTPMGLEVLSINAGFNDSLDKAKRYVKKYRMPYPVGFDTGSTISNAYEIRGVPTVMIIDRQGVIQYMNYTVPSDAYLRENIDRFKK